MQVILYYMEQQVQLVVAQSTEGDVQDYLIFKNIELGHGSFCVVKKALSTKHKTRELAVKIVPYGGDPIKRQIIGKEINIIRALPDHPNLIRFIPVKCFSENNFYIFMEMCDETLQDWINQPGQLEQGKIFDAFWQLMSGYRVLWTSGILHQNLQPSNVLIRKGVLKIADFSFSIFAENYVPSKIRKGTMKYMSLEKLTDENFIADEKAEVYALGVIMHQLMTKLHPYVNQKDIENGKDYVTALQNAEPLRPQKVSNISAPLRGLYDLVNVMKELYHENIVCTFSARLRGLYDLVTRMAAKQPKNRVSCSEIFEYLDNEQVFAAYRQRQSEKSKEVQVNRPAMKITEKTLVYVVPFEVGPEEEDNYVYKTKILVKMEKWALDMRLIIQFFNKLALRLSMEKYTGAFGEEKAHSFDRAILSSLLAQSKMTRCVLKKLRYPQFFSREELQLFRSSKQGGRTSKELQREQERIHSEITENIKRTTYVLTEQQMFMIDSSEKEGFTEFIAKVVPFFEDCISQKAGLITSRKDLVTIIYLIDTITILSSLPQTSRQLELKQEYFQSTETRSLEELLKQVQRYFTNRKIEVLYDMDIFAEEAVIN